MGPISMLSSLPAISPSTPKSSTSPFIHGYSAGHYCDSRGSPNLSIASSNTTMSEHIIDHTALLLGFCDEFGVQGGEDEEETSKVDDEREWNACFSPNASLLDEPEVGKEIGVTHGKANNLNHNKKTGDNSGRVHVGETSSHRVGGVLDGESSVGLLAAAFDGLQLNSDCETLDAPPATNSHRPYSKVEGTTHKVITRKHPDANGATERMSRVHNNNQQARNGSSDDRTDLGLSNSSARLDQADECTFSQNNSSALEDKRRVTKMKALTTRERASSAIVTKTHKSMETVSDKLKEHHWRVQHSWAQQRHHEHSQTDGMEIATVQICDDNELLSHVSEATRSSLAATKKEQFKSKIAQVAQNIKSKQTGSNSIASRSKRANTVSAVAAMKDKASSALSQKAQLTKERIISGSPVVRLKKQHKSMMIRKTQTGLASALPSLSKPHCNVQEEIHSGALDSEALSIGKTLPHDTPMIITTPDALSRKSLQVMRAPRQSNGTATGHHFHDLLSPPVMSPQLCMLSSPPISTCHSNISSLAACSSQISCIDEKGFLVSPSASVDPSENDADAIAECSSTAGSEGSFDPNSFLFLSPLSNTDRDDPDYGMPELLSQPISHNAVLLDAPVGSIATSRGTGNGSDLTRSALMARKGLSLKHPKLMPRLPPSGKKTSKKIKCRGKS